MERRRAETRPISLSAPRPHVSFIGDGAGSQLWVRRYGNLRGDRRHQLKLYGFRQLPWRASVGGFAVFPFLERYNVQVALDLFNVFDKQTGYNIQNKVNTGVGPFGQPRSFYDPRRLQIAVRFHM